MTERQEQLLKLIIEQYIETAEPIGSKVLVAQNDLKVSDATVRNEMRVLEERGFLTHPHTSAGRIPTASGYKHYITKLMQPTFLEKELESELRGAVDGVSQRKERVKVMVKRLAPYTGTAFIVAFGRDAVYYTGISQLFAQPEFHNIANMVTMSGVFDHCEERIGTVIDALDGKKIGVLIGEENPLGSVCGLVGTVLKGGITVVSLGPMRMDYARSTGTIGFILEGLS